MQEYIDKKLNEFEVRFNIKIDNIETNVIEKITSQFMQTLDNERNSQIKFQSEIDKRHIEFEHKVNMSLESLKNIILVMEGKTAPKWHSLFILGVSVISFATVIVLLLIKL